MTTFREKSRPTKVLSKYARTGWTPERKFIQAIAIQRWRPWEHSTGPRTPRGKAQAALNAYGAYPGCRNPSLAAVEQFYWSKDTKGQRQISNERQLGPD
jgi:hypothetical protein